MHRSVMLPRCTVSHHVEAICYLQPSACRMPALSTSSRHQSQRRQGVNPCTSSTAYRPVVPSALPASQRLCSSHFYRSKLQQVLTSHGSHSTGAPSSSSARAAVAPWMPFVNMGSGHWEQARERRSTAGLMALFFHVLPLHRYAISVICGWSRLIPCRPLR